MFDTPSDVTATAASSSSINVSWNSVTGADGYYIYRSTSSSGTYNQIGFSTSTSYTNNGLSPSLTYYYKVEAYKGTLKSPQSVSVSATTHSTGSGTINAKDTAMVFVQGGTFTMGCTSEQESNCDSSEKPIFSVTLSNYSIGKYEVTQRLWEAVMNNNPSNFKGDGSRPVETVSWNDVDTFIVKLNALTGKKYRLPTEAEWEYAARGGNKASGHKYAGSDTIGTVAWYYGNNGSSGSINYGTKPVGTKEPNELGIYDMSGNVWEWVSDWYEEYTSWAKTNPRGPESGSYRVFRGGGWYNDASHCRVSDRYDYYPGNRNSDIGFRLVLPSP
jgi:formylglycine-generating enzyme required for sulfatase activity